MTRRGNRGGRPPISEATKSIVYRLYDEDEMTCKEIAQAVSISEASLYRILRERERREDVNG